MEGRHYGCTECRIRRRQGEKSNTLTSHGPGIHRVRVRIDTSQCFRFSSRFIRRFGFLRNNRNDLHIVMVLLAQTDISLNVSLDVNLMRSLRFVLELFLANTCLHALKWVIQTSGQIVWFKWRQHSGASGLCLTSKWWRTQTINCR